MCFLQRPGGKTAMLDTEPEEYGLPKESFQTSSPQGATEPYPGRTPLFKRIVSE